MPDGEYGPFATERDARATEACAAEHAAWSVPGDGEKFNMRLLVGICEQLGVELGAYDLSPLGQVAMYETSKCVALRGIIRRAYEAGKAAGPDGTVTEWGVHWEPPEGAPNAPVSLHSAQPVDGEDVARIIARIMPPLPGWTGTVMQRQATPWKEVPDE